MRRNRHKSEKRPGSIHSLSGILGSDYGASKKRALSARAALWLEFGREIEELFWRFRDRLSSTLPARPS